MWGLAGGGVWALQWTRHMVDNTKKVQKKKCFQRGSNQSVVLSIVDNFPFGHKRDAGICTNLRI